MAALLLTCHRRSNPVLEAHEVDALATHLAPEGVTPSTEGRERGGVQLIAFGPSSTIEWAPAACALGLFGTRPVGWDTVGGPVLDTAHLVFRWDEDAIEIVGDVVGSRTLWYVCTEELFVASTSQRAAVGVLRSFEPNLEARIWMLSAGNLGPGLSWDARLEFLGADGCVRLDRNRWTCDHRTRTPHFAGRRAHLGAAGSNLDEVLSDTLGALEIDPERWVLPLSGGSDSRAVATSVRRAPGLRAITWGRPGAGRDGDDVAVARAVADRLGLQHRFIPLDGHASPEIVFERFVQASEGRSDHIAGYLDGMALWMLLAHEGVAGIIRGDQAFGWTANRTDTAIRRSVEAVFLEEVHGTEPIHLAVQEAWGTQVWPSHLHRTSDETSEGWRDRLYAQYRSAVVLAPLTDVKSSYVEVASPLLARSIVNVARTVPDRWRTRKRLYRRVIAGRLPDIPYATASSLTSASEHLRDSRSRAWLLEALGSPTIREVVPDEVVDHVLGRLRPTDGLATTGGSRSLRAARRAVPPSVRKAVATRVTLPLTVTPEVLGLRVLIIARSSSLLGTDAGVLGPLAD